MRDNEHCIQIYKTVRKKEKKRKEKKKKLEGSFNLCKFYLN